MSRQSDTEDVLQDFLADVAGNLDRLSHLRAALRTVVAGTYAVRNETGDAWHWQIDAHGLAVENLWAPRQCAIPLADVEQLLDRHQARLLA